MKSQKKVKLWQGIILFAILLIEIIGFHNEWKYCMLEGISPSLLNYFTKYLLASKIISIVLLITMIFTFWLKLYKEESEPLFIVYLIKGFQVKGSDLIGILNVIFVLCSIAWVGVEFYNHTLNGYLNSLIYACFLILYPLIVARYFLPKEPSKDEYQPKILIYAVSNLEEKFLRPSLIEMEEKYPDKWHEQVFYNENGAIKTIPSGAPWGPWGNFDPLRKSIIFHKALFKEIILIVSSEASGKIDKLPENIKPVKLISDFLEKCFKGHDIKVKIVSDDISGNDMKLNEIVIKDILKTLFARNFKNRDILFNITGGTAAISGAMILNAIPGERRAEYARQDTGIIEDIPLDIYDVKELWNELLEKVG